MCKRLHKSPQLPCDLLLYRIRIHRNPSRPIAHLHTDALKDMFNAFLELGLLVSFFAEPPAFRLFFRGDGEEEREVGSREGDVGAAAPFVRHAGCVLRCGERDARERIAVADDGRASVERVCYRLAAIAR